MNLNTTRKPTQEQIDARNAVIRARRQAYTPEQKAEVAAKAREYNQRPEVKAARAEAQRKWLAANPHKKVEYSRDWRAKNPEKRKAMSLKWRLANQEKVKAAGAAWSKANPAKCTARVAKRAAIKQKATPAWADLAAIQRIYVEAGRLTAETEVPHEVDHYYPLNSPMVCGFHVEHNLRVITAIENQIKSNRMPTEETE